MVARTASEYQPEDEKKYAERRIIELSDRKIVRTLRKIDGFNAILISYKI